MCVCVCVYVCGDIVARYEEKPTLKLLRRKASFARVYILRVDFSSYRTTIYINKKEQDCSERGFTFWRFLALQSWALQISLPWATWAFWPGLPPSRAWL